MCSHQQDFGDSQYSAAWNHPQTKHKQTSHTPIMVPFQMLHFSVRISLTRDPQNPVGRRRLPWPPRSFPRSQLGVFLAAHGSRLQHQTDPQGSEQASPWPRRLAWGRCSRLAREELSVVMGTVTRGQTCTEAPLGRGVCTWATSLRLGSVGLVAHQSLVTPTHTHALPGNGIWSCD